jgi:hypothetical protein
LSIANLDMLSLKKDKIDEILEEEEDMYFDEVEKKWKKGIVKFLDHPITSIFMTLITVYSLFFDDIRVLGVSKDADNVFYVITLICMACFLVEIVLASIAKDDYFLTFFFWLDLISTLSMVTDVGWIMQGGKSSGGNVGSLAKTGRASRVTRVIRIVRLIRLIRIVKLYK